MKRNNSCPSLFNTSNLHWSLNQNCNCSSQNKPQTKEIKPETENIIEINQEEKNKSFITNYLNLVIFFLLALFFIGFIIIICIKKSSKAKNCKESHCNLIHTTKEGWAFINQNKGKSNS
jgi:hypothetical protein